ncbi:hypothetical protein [Streptomyces collinus]|uniref:hypothetical protein n=1 Tax=Streptomyces collinus TaxID=42684 RepID=UPI0037FF8D0B
MTIRDIAEQVRDAVHTGVARGKTLQQLDDDIRTVLDGVPHADIKAVHAHITATDDH